VNTTTRPLEVLLPRDQPPLSNREMWLGMSATLVVMALVGLWFVGAL
jgi:hypothetical protein